MLKKLINYICSLRKPEPEIVEVEVEEKVKQNPYKIIISGSLMAEVELNRMYTIQNWELIQVINNSTNLYYHLFKSRNI